MGSGLLHKINSNHLPEALPQVPAALEQRQTASNFIMVTSGFDNIL